MQTIKQVLEKYLSQMDELQITHYLNRVWDQDVVYDARENYEYDIKAQLDYYLSNSSHLDASLDNIIESWIDKLFEVKKSNKQEIWSLERHRQYKATVVSESKYMWD